MIVRVGFDMDCVFADFAKAHRDVEATLFGRPAAAAAVANDARSRAPEDPAREYRRRRPREQAVWDTIRDTSDFWVALDPIAPGAVRRLQALVLERGWEVFFVTERPPSGDSVQRQTQRWLIDQGFDMPSVLPVSHPRTTLLSALSLHHYVDDDAANCVDVKSACGATPILIVRDDDVVAVSSARRLGIATAPGIAAALDILEAVTDKEVPQPLQPAAVERSR